MYACIAQGGINNKINEYKIDQKPTRIYAQDSTSISSK